MARFDFRIGTKLGRTTGIGVVLVAGMLVSQLMGNQSIALLSRWVVINTSSKANTQAAESAILRAQLAALKISGATAFVAKALAAGTDLAKARDAVIAGFAALNQTNDAWSRGLDQLLRTGPRAITICST